MQLLSFETLRQQSVITQRSIVYREPQIEQYLDRLVASLMLGEETEGVVPKLVLISDLNQNAYSFPNGVIYIHTGLLARLESEAELAFLLSHELIHITRKHALRSLSLSLAEADQVDSDPTRSDSLAWFHQATAEKTLPHRSEETLSMRRSLEEEADLSGLDMVIKAGYDPFEAIEIFEHLRDNTNSGTDADRTGLLLRALIQRQPVTDRLTDRSILRKRLQNLLFGQGLLEVRHGRLEEALRCARRLLGEVPTHARGHFLLGDILRQRNEAGDEQRALSHYHRAIATDPSLPGPHKAIASSN